jgi:hypothetical protein
MIAELSNLLRVFPGATNRSRCFTHTLNLAAKSIIKQFDLPKVEAKTALDEAAKELAKLAIEMEHEEFLLRGSVGCEDVDLDDNLEGWVDENTLLSDEERGVLNESMKPVQLMLVKVR